MSERGGYTFRVTYTHDRAGGMTYSFAVLAWSEELAAMYAGMLRSESFLGRFSRSFWTSPVKWERLSVERVR